MTGIASEEEWLLFTEFTGQLPKKGEINMKRPWKDFAAFMVDTYGVMAYIDDPDEDADENVVYCPGCEEPIYEEDYPMIDVTEDGKFICPICEEAFDN